jgi:hypothetical protein
MPSRTETAVEYLWKLADSRVKTDRQAGVILWVGIIIAVIPWRHLLAQYVRAPGHPWRRSR